MINLKTGGGCALHLPKRDFPATIAYTADAGASPYKPGQTTIPVQKRPLTPFPARLPGVSGSGGRS